MYSLLCVCNSNCTAETRTLIAFATPPKHSLLIRPRPFPNPPNCDRQPHGSCSLGASSSKPSPPPTRTLSSSCLGDRCCRRTTARGPTSPRGTGEIGGGAQRGAGRPQIGRVWFYTYTLVGRGCWWRVDSARAAATLSTAASPRTYLYDSCS